MKRSLLALIICFIAFLSGYSQVNIVSIANGDWMDTLTWSCNCVPDFNADTITIAGGHNVTVSANVQVDQIIVGADAILTIAEGGTLIVLNGDGFDLTQKPHDSGQGTSADGRVAVENGGVLENRGSIASIPSAMIFSDGAEYRHNQTLGAIVGATWEIGSTCRIIGWVASPGSVPTLFGTSLSQGFFNFVWDCQGQTAANVILSGYLTTVNGDFVINSTNASTSSPNRLITLGSTSEGFSGSLSVLGDFIVRNGSKVTLTSSGTYTVNVGGNVELGSTAPNASPVPNHYLINSSGATTYLNIGGDLMLNSGQLNLSRATGGIPGTANITIGGNLVLNGGSVHRSGANGTGNILFSGSATHYLTAAPGTLTANQAVNYDLGVDGTLNLMEEANLEGNLTVHNGAILNLNADLSVAGNVVFNTGSILSANNHKVTLNGSTNQTFSAAENTLRDLVIEKINQTDVELTSPLAITGKLSILSTGTTLVSDGNLRLVSTSDSDSENASIGPLADEASVSGDVIVERFMSSEGRIYRYLSSPIEDESIADLQGYFPITGLFPQSSPCPGCSANPSFFYYDAQQATYVAFPASSNTEVLTPGRGYSAFIRQDLLEGPATLEMTGRINQGDVTLPVFYNSGVTESWNLVGNPYPSTINWDLAEGWTRAGINGEIAVRDNHQRMFMYWNGETGSLQNGRIATGQAFWVQTTAPSPQLIIHEASKTDTTGAFFRQASPDVMILKLSKGDLWDKAYFQIQKNAAIDFDFYDAPKLENDSIDLSTRFDNTSRLAINAVDQIPCDHELSIDLRFKKETDGTFVLKPAGSYLLQFEIQGRQFSNYKITLIDFYAGKQTDIANNFTYTFSITEDPASFAPNRLELSFQYLGVAEISIMDGDILSSNFETGNQWFFNDQKIEGATNKFLRAERSGKYHLEVTVGSCRMTSELEYSITSTAESNFMPLTVFPNPTTGQILVKTSEKVKRISLLNNLGQEVGVFTLIDEGLLKTAYLNAQNLANGIYFLRAAFPRGTATIKIIKKSD